MYDVPQEDPGKGDGKFAGRYKGVGFGISMDSKGKECGIKIRTVEGGTAEIRFDDFGQFKHTFLSPLQEFSKAASDATGATGEIDAEQYMTAAAAITKRYKKFVG